MGNLDDQLIFERYTTVVEAEAVPLGSYPKGTTFQAAVPPDVPGGMATGRVQNYVLKGPAAEGAAATHVLATPSDNPTGAMVQLDITTVDMTTVKQPERGTTADAKEEDPGTAGWATTAQAGIEGGPLSTDKDSLVKNVQVPGVAQGVAQDDWLTRGAMQVGSNVIGKLGKKAPARANAAIGY
jgi:hypothetical protein